MISEPLLLRFLSFRALLACTSVSVAMDSMPSKAPPISLKVAKVAKAGVSYPTGDKSFKVLQPWPKVLPAETVDPFLMLDEWGDSTKKMGVPARDCGPLAVAGEPHVGWHPHRGFDILSYIKEGRGRHADSLGNLATVRPGGVQWMRTGSGVEHAEGGGTPKGASQHGFQIWINLPSDLKMSSPAYGTVQPENVPEHLSKEGGLARILAGPGGASFQSHQGIHIADIEMPPSTSLRHYLPAGLPWQTVIVYVYRGPGFVGGHKVQPHHAAMLEVRGEPQPVDNDAEKIIELTAGEDGQGVGLLIFAGRRLAEPIAWHGPIVMNTDEEVQLAFEQLQEGSFYKERVSYDYQAAADAQDDRREDEL